MIFLYNKFIYEPIYNGLVFLIDILPFWAGAGVAIIILTVIVKIILFPLSKKSVRTQLKMRKLEPEMKEIKEKFTDKQEQAKKTLELYKKEGVNPFAGFFLILIQLPIIFALYKVFYSSGIPSINADLLYSFVKVPEAVNINFLGLVDIAGKSFVLALIAGVTTYLQVRYSMPVTPKKKEAGAKSSFQEDFARSMQIQMKYIFPVIAFFISWSISGAIALYWITSNIFAICQELVIRKSVDRELKADQNKPSVV